MRVMSRPTEEPRYPIESVGNALTVLTLLRSPMPVRTADVADHLGIARSTAHRLLATLQAQGFVTPDDTGQGYVAGPELRRLGATAVARLTLRQVAHGPLLDLARSTGETSELAILEGHSILLIDVVEGTHALRVVDRVGSRASAIAGAAGKAILANLPGTELAAFSAIPERGGSPSWGAFLHEIAEIQAAGYAVTWPNAESGYLSVAAPVRTDLGQQPAAVSVVLPEVRANASLVADLGPQVAEAARVIAAAHPPPAAGRRSTTPS